MRKMGEKYGKVEEVKERKGTDEKLDGGINGIKEAEISRGKRR